MTVRVIPEKRAKGYEEMSGWHQWFVVEELVTAFREGKPFRSQEGYKLGREANGVLPDGNLEAALRKTVPGVGVMACNASVLPARAMGKDDILKGVAASTGRPYAW